MAKTHKKINMKYINNKAFFYILFASIATSMLSCTTVEPGHKGVKVKWGGKTDMDNVYEEGMKIGVNWIWDDMIEYDCREQTMTINENFLDYDGLDTKVEIILYYNPDPSKVNQLHTKIGNDFRQGKLQGIFKGAVKNVIAKHEALKLNREERQMAEEELSKILTPELESMFVDFKRVQVTDVGLPDKISKMIEATKEQDERNNLASKKELEAKNLANAQIARAKGEYEAATYDAKTKEILSQPQMLELKRLELQQEWIEKWDGSFGTDNVFGADGMSILKGMK